MTKETEGPKQPGRVETTQGTDKSEWVLKPLAFEIKRLPPESEARRNLEEIYMYLFRIFERLPEDKAVKAYRALRAKITAARFERARAELTDLHRQLNLTGDGVKWNRQPAGKILADWLRGPSTWPDSVDESFILADEIYHELSRRIEEASQPRYSRKHTEMAHTGKTENEVEKRARHLKNRAARADENRAHKKGPSGGGGHQSHPSNKKGGKKR